MALVKKIILPECMTMIQMSGICQVCNTPEGSTKVYSANNQHDASNRLGFYICSKQECEKYMNNYIDTIYFNLYESQKWNTILLALANRSFIKVQRSNGDINFDWKITFSEYRDSDNIIDILNENPLNFNFITSMLCASDKFNFHISSVIWENIFNMTLDLYRKYVHLIFGFGLETYVMVYKDSLSKTNRIGKLVDIDTLLEMQ